MYGVEIYYKVRRAHFVDGVPIHEVSRVFGIHRDTVRKMLSHSVPPGYRRRQPPARPKLVLRFTLTCGYRCLSFVGAWSLVNCQSTPVCAAFRSSAQALASSLRVSISGIRRLRHYLVKTLNPISATSNQLPCLGVYAAARGRGLGEGRGWHPVGECCCLTEP